jgi:hypothetical protein
LLRRVVAKETSCWSVVAKIYMFLGKTLEKVEWLLRTAVAKENGC